MTIPIKLLAFDIETAPALAYIWDPKTRFVPASNLVEPGYTMCFAAKWYGKKRVMFDSIYKSEPDDMFRHMYQLLEEADAVMHYNGDNFDIPTLNMEFAQRGWPPPKPYESVDLFKTVSRKFRLPYKSMDYVAKVLGIGGKVHHKGMGLWKECMELNKQAWKVMKEYNIQDVHICEKMFDKIKPWVMWRPNVALYVLNQHDPMCGLCGSTRLQSRGFKPAQTQVYPQWQCMDCGKWLRGTRTIKPKDKQVLTAINQ